MRVIVASGGDDSGVNVGRYNNTRRSSRLSPFS